VPQGNIGRVYLFLQMPAGTRIVIPGDKIQGFRQVVIIDLVETKAHEIMRDEMGWAGLSQDIYLLLLEAYIGIRNEAVVVQFQAGVGNATRIQRYRDL